MYPLPAMVQIFRIFPLWHLFNWICLMKRQLPFSLKILRGFGIVCPTIFEGGRTAGSWLFRAVGRYENPGGLYGYGCLYGGYNLPPVWNSVNASANIYQNMVSNRPPAPGSDGPPDCLVCVALPDSVRGYVGNSENFVKIWWWFFHLPQLANLRSWTKLIALLDDTKWHKPQLYSVTILCRRYCQRKMGILPKSVGLLYYFSMYASLLFMWLTVLKVVKPQRILSFSSNIQELFKSVFTNFFYLAIKWIGSDFIFLKVGQKWK